MESLPVALQFFGVYPIENQIADRFGRKQGHEERQEKGKRQGNQRQSQKKKVGKRDAGKRDKVKKDGENILVYLGDAIGGVKKIC